MKTRIQKWGNSLAIRIPKSLANQSHLDRNSWLEMTVEDGKIILEPIIGPGQRLAELLQGVNEENLHAEMDTGSPSGREMW